MHKVYIDEQGYIGDGLPQIEINYEFISKEDGVMGDRVAFKPFSHPEFFEFFKLQHQAHWLPTEVSLADDVTDYKVKLTASERNLIIQVLRFFTQGDIEVQKNYNNNLLKFFKKPEILLMLNVFASTETIHVWAYSHLNDTLGLPESEYSAFMEYESMKAKYDYIQNFDVLDVNDISGIAKNLAVFGAFMEGVSLFSSFAILMNFPRLGKMKGVGQIITWSQKDETLHAEGICALYRTLTGEHPEILTTGFINGIYDACSDMVRLEDNFIDTCFSLGEVEGITPSQLKEYIRFIANRRLDWLNLDPLYPDAKNPLEWISMMMNGKEHANFFETRSTEYSKGSIIDNWDD